MTQYKEFIALSDKVQINNADLLGSGSTGNVYGGTYKSSNYQEPLAAAIKAIPLQTINSPVMGYLLQCQIQAMKILSKTKNPYIVMLYDVIFLNNYVYIVMEKLNGGTLRDFMNKCYGIIQKKTILQIFAKIIQGYSSLQANKIIHRDLKPQNIIFRDKNYMEPCIIDFGYCVSPQVKNIPNMHYNVGSPKYMSPEAYKLSKYSEKSDVWALGVILYQIFIGKAFDQGIQIQQSLEMLEKKGVPYPSNFDQHLINFLNHLLICNFQIRANFSQVRESVKNYYYFKTKMENKSTLNTQNSDIEELQFPQNLRRTNTQNFLYFDKASQSKSQFRKLVSNVEMKKITTARIVSKNNNFEHFSKFYRNPMIPAIPMRNQTTNLSYKPIQRYNIQQKPIVIQNSVAPHTQLKKIYSNKQFSSFNPFQNYNGNHMNFHNNPSLFESRQIKLSNSQFIHKQAPKFFQPINQNPISSRTDQKLFNFPIYQPKCQKTISSPNFIHENAFKKLKQVEECYVGKNRFYNNQYRQLRKIVKIN